MPVYAEPPPPYEAVVSAALDTSLLRQPFVPPRYTAPTEGRNSIIYSQLPPLYDTTKIFLVDNKSADISSLNYQSDHSDFLTTVIQNADFTPSEGSNQTINLDERSRWVGDLKTILHTAMPNINEFMFSNSFRARLMSARGEDGTPEYTWFDLFLPEGNYSLPTVIELMNNAVLENYLLVGRQNGVKEEDIGVKFDTRNFRLGYDPVTGLVTPGIYTYEAFHPDVVLLPGCAVDFTSNRLNNVLGIRKRLPFQEGFVIAYEDLVGGNIPALMDRDAFSQRNEIVPVARDPSGRSYHVGADSTALSTDTAYRSWFLSYNYGDPEKGIRSSTLLTTPDITCGAEQLYWSLPDMAVEPVSFRAAHKTSNLPVVGVELLPLQPRSFYNAQAVYSQLIKDSTSRTHVFNRFPDNQILLQPPAPAISTITENVPSLTDHGTIPMKNTIKGVQRVSVTDARRRPCPYVQKAVGLVTPRVISSRTIQ